jgi:hypothetical protein
MTVPRTGFRCSMLGLERVYVAASLSRMFDRINLIFPEKGYQPPSPEEATSVVKVRRGRPLPICVELA